MNILIKTLGCRLNQAESQNLAEQLQKAGFFVMDDKSKEQADIIVVNSCAVTEKADNQSLQTIQKLKKKNPDAFLVMIGCSRFEMEEIDLFVGNKEKVVGEIIERFYNINEGGFHQIRRNNISGGNSDSRLQSDQISGRTRVNVKIQDGCENYCTYCITTHRRGKSRSIDPDKIITEINERVQQGYKEIVITGVNIGQYEYHVEVSPEPLRSGRAKKNMYDHINHDQMGRINDDNMARVNHEQVDRVNHEQVDRVTHGQVDRVTHGHGGPRLTLIDLLNKILDTTKIERIRLSSINPEYIYQNQEFLNLFQNPRMCQHLHMSLQSGSDKILKLMNRHYTRDQYLDITKIFYKHYPNFGFTTDIIVGFPGESDADFKKSISLAEKAKFLKIHIFRYSKRPGTPAAEMNDQVDEKTKSERAKQLETINQKLKTDFQNNMIGQELDVLIEGERKGEWLGTAGNFLKVKIDSKKDIKNKILKMKIKEDILS